ncbi:nucleoporin autopeptidase-domain-containing protein [Trametes elegans]|nr:nucleoporin autopeptidase-domain-containing protein [Trametes elegans]
MFGSSWANPQQNQQNQQQPSAFGQPSGFGASSAFGSGGAFGQPQQPQQPQANPMFGNLGGAATTNTNTPGTTGFGAFGNTNTSNAGGGLFGQPKPAGGFGAFGGGGTSAFGSSTTTTPAFGAGAGGGAFGNNNATAGAGGTGLFGAQPSTSTSAFGGGGGGLFGANKPAAAFGAPAVATDASAPVTTGTANTPFNAYTEKDNVNPSITLQYQSITAMPQYRSASFEELRLQDYQQGRKTAGAFGQSSFGAPAQPAQPSTGLFGQPAAPAATGSTFGGFGNPGTTNQPATSGFGAFGQPANNTTNTTGGGLFGGGGAFGQPNQQQQQPQTNTGFGAFGQPQNQQQNATGGGLFGGGGAFGANNQTKPAFGTTGTTGFGTGGAFGQTQPAAGGGLFGQTQPNNTTTTGFGAFGANSNASKPSLFGGATNTTQPATTGFGAFGTQNQSQQQQATQPSGGLFGGGGGLFGQNQPQNTQQQPQAGGGLFGNTQTGQQQQPSGGLFGGGGGLFGNNQQQPTQQGAQPQQNQNAFGGGLFGAKPATNTTQPSGGLFGGGFGSNTGSTLGQPPQNQQPAGGLFGSTLGQPPQNQQNTNAFGGGGLFGKPAAPTLGASTSTGQQQGGLGSSLFGNSTLGASTTTMGASNLGQSQTPLTASIAQPIAAPLPIFSMLPPGPRAVTLDQQPKKKPGYFVDVPTRSPVPQLQLRYAPAGTKLRGFGSTSAPLGAGSSTLGGSLLYSSGKPNALSLSKASSTKSLLGPDAFLINGAPSPTLGSSGKQSVKKLTLDKKVEPADLFSKSNSGSSFSPALSLAAREKEAAAANAPNAVLRFDSPTPAPRNEAQKKASNRFAAQTTSEYLGSPTRPAPHPATSSAKGPRDPAELQEGDYWVKPDLDTLKKMGHDELMSFSGLTVGRVGYGEITFLEPVDLTGLPRLSSLLGEIVRFDDKECSVYPDADDAEKPPAGAGLNVKARIVLVRCWALDKATREPIKDPAHPGAQRHLKRLKNMKETHFEDFDIEEGKWTFTVDHF